MEYDIKYIMRIKDWTNYHQSYRRVNLRFSIYKDYKGKYKCFELRAMKIHVLLELNGGIFGMNDSSITYDQWWNINEENMTRPQAYICNQK